MAGDAGRVIAGSAAGRRLSAPGPGTRPLSDRVKQTLFAILEPELPGAHFLDLCAGSGAGGIEALSRGAALAVLVEQDGRTCKVIAENLARTGLDGPNAVVVRAAAETWLGSALQPAGPPPGAPFGIVLLDPPYDQVSLLESPAGDAGQPRRGQPAGGRRPGRGQAFLAGRSAGPDRPATIDPRTALR